MKRYQAAIFSQKIEAWIDNNPAIKYHCFIFTAIKISRYVSL